MIPGGWRVSVDHGFGRCNGEVRRGGVRAQCFRSGPYGWEDKHYCYQHHPDWPKWYAESERVQKIAHAAIERAWRCAP